MRNGINRRQFCAAAAAVGLAPSAVAQAGDWPKARPVRIVATGVAGAGTDIYARLFAEQYAKIFGQSFIVENRPGANGAIGNDVVAKAAPDGYTLLWSYAAAIAVNAALFPKLPYDTLKDLQPIAQVGSGGNMLMVAPDLPVKDLKEFVALVKASPGKYDYGSWGVGSGGHLSMEALATQAGLKMNHVPYRATAALAQDMMGGVIKIGFLAVETAQVLHKAGKGRPIAISGTRRAPNMTDIPTMTEQGFKFDIDAWYCLMAPGGTPMPIVRRLNEETNRLLQDPAMGQRLVALNFAMPAPIKTVEQFTQTIRDDIDTWSKVIKAANIKPEG
ncbi:MAG: tripartite tricarboxylate transporter substrate binding protein [Burkholderiales bacterium]|nr:tripartite tricarboxylate transporter substrate binding protein [Burkholderiales bacterium]